MKSPWRTLFTLLLALCLPLQGVAASGGWWCALQGHDPLRMGAVDVAPHAHHHGTPAPADAHAGHAPVDHHGHHSAATADPAQPREPAAAWALSIPTAADTSAVAAASADAAEAPSSATPPAAGSCSVCAACCAVGWLPPAPWRTPEVPDANPWTAAQAAWPARLTLGNLDRPPRSRSA